MTINRLSHAAVLAAALLYPGLCRAAMTVQERAAQLNSQSAAERADAAENLGNMGVQDPVVHDYLPRLIELLGDSDTKVRSKSADAISKLKDIGSAVPALTARLNDPDAMTRNRAVHALGYAGEAAVPVLPQIRTALLGDPAQMVRVDAACALEQLGPLAASATRDLLTAALHDEDGLVRAQSVEAMMSIDPEDKGVSRALGKSLSDKDEDVRANAADGLDLVAKIKAYRRAPKSIFTR